HLYTVYTYFFHDTETTQIYTLSLHDALPISTLMAVKYKPRKRPEICANVLKVPAESDASGRVCCNHVIRTCAPAQCCAIHSRKVDGPRIFLSKNSRAATRSAA